MIGAPHKLQVNEYTIEKAADYIGSTTCKVIELADAGTIRTRFCTVTGQSVAMISDLDRLLKIQGGVIK